MKPTCPYCDHAAEFATGADIYPHRPDLGALNFWRCQPCGAFVGCHKAGSYRFEDDRKIAHDGTEPLGRLADAELRRAKMAAHAAFDPMWKARGMGRRQAYAWLADRLRLPVERTHIGEFDAATCARVVAICSRPNVSYTTFVVQ
jgi:zinc-finger-containing domain